MTTETKQKVALHGKPEAQPGITRDGGYEAREEYADQGDTRVVRDLLFGYTIVADDAAGNEVVHAREALRNDEVSIEQIGLLGLKKGEDNHSFYTTAELERLRNPQTVTGTVATDANISDLGEFELAEWLAPEGQKAPTVDEVLEAVGDDKELAHRMLQAENIRSDGDPRKGLEVGLSRIIQEG